MALKLASGEPNTLDQVRKIAAEFNAHVELRDVGRTVYFFQEGRPEWMSCDVDMIASLNLRNELTTVFGPANAPIIENFANHPKSIGELRADRSQMANDWSPRDALIDVLRGIDSGEITLDALVIVGRRTHEDGSIKIERRVCSPDAIVAVGLLNRAAFEIQHSNAHDD